MSGYFDKGFRIEVRIMPLIPDSDSPRPVVMTKPDRGRVLTVQRECWTTEEVIAQLDHMGQELKRQWAPIFHGWAP